MLRFIICLFALVALGAGCSRSSSANSAEKPAEPAGSNQVFQVRGVIKEIERKGNTVHIRHEEIPNYMPAMVMAFTAKNPAELQPLKAGDGVNFRMTVTADEVWIDQISKTAAPSASAETNQFPTNSSFRFVRDVEPLQIGDRMPEYHFTNELGQAVSTEQFKGQALAISFIFTRCPLPTFCPRMSSNFEQVQQKMGSTARTNWHLFTVTFDPAFDTPPILKSYAERYKADPARWSFLTGDLVEIGALSDQFGQKFWREEGALNHNLRTVVIDAAGKVQQIFQGNSWTADDLVAELQRAAEAK